MECYEASSFYLDFGQKLMVLPFDEQFERLRYAVVLETKGAHEERIWKYGVAFVGRGC